MKDQALGSVNVTGRDTDVRRSTHTASALLRKSGNYSMEPLTEIAEESAPTSGFYHC